MTNAIDTAGLARAYGRLEAVKGIDLRVPAGSMFALIGPNGAGKTTTIKLLMNLMKPTRGSAQILGVDSRRLGADEFRRIGYVSENQQLPEWMTVDRLLDYCRPLYPTWDEDLCRKLRTDLGLTSNVPLRHQSRGTRMRAALLASLAYRPELVILDEPFTGLDPLVREQLGRGLLELPGQQPLSVLISSHDVEEVERLADWVGFMVRGRLLFAEPVASLLERFRLVEVVAESDVVMPPEPSTGWIVQGISGRTLRFVDMDHRGSESEASIAAGFPAASIRISPMSLREVFVLLARVSERAEAA